MDFLPLVLENRHKFKGASIYTEEMLTGRFMRKIHIYLASAIFIIFAVDSGSILAQAIYDSNGQYKGYSQTSPSGVTTTYSPQGQSLGSSQIDNGQTNYYSPNGVYVGTNTAMPAPAVPNTTINTPRQVPQAPVIKGW